MLRFAVSLCLALAMLVAAQSVDAAVYTVTKIADTNDGTCDADCSLREAIAAANATIDNDTIVFAYPFFSVPRTITLGGSELVVANNGSLTIFGSGANRLTINGNNASRILVSGANVVVNLHHLRFTGGNGVGATNTGRGGAIYNVGGTMLIKDSLITGNTAANGGALNNAASASPSVPANLTIDNCVISFNSSTSSGGAMQNFSTSTLHLRNSTIHNNNSASTGIAGAFQANGMVTISNSTFSGNTTAGTGGAIYYNGTGLTMTNVTVAGNTSPLGSGGFHKATTTLNANVRNSLFAGNTGAGGTGDALGAVSSLGNNLIQTVGTSTGWIASDLQNMNPLIAPFGFYGGAGMTFALLSGSPALNAGQDCVVDLSCAAANPPVALNADQRGAPRAGVVDIGAYEDNSAYFALMPSVLFNQPFSAAFIPNVGSFSYSATSGTLPAGVTVTTGGVSANIGGTPTQKGLFNFGVTGTNGANSAVVNYSLYVLDDLAFVPVTGRVTTFSGRSAPGVLVGLTDQSGATRYAKTNGFGFYSFSNVPAGQVYVVSLGSKGYIFTPQTITVTDATFLLDFVVIPEP